MNELAVRLSRQRSMVDAGGLHFESWPDKSSNLQADLSEMAPRQDIAQDHEQCHPRREDIERREGQLEQFIGGRMEAMFRPLQAEVADKTARLFSLVQDVQMRLDEKASRQDLQIQLDEKASRADCVSLWQRLERDAASLRVETVGAHDQLGKMIEERFSRSELVRQSLEVEIRGLRKEMEELLRIGPHAQKIVDVEKSIAHILDDMAGLRSAVESPGSYIRHREADACHQIATLQDQVGKLVEVLNGKATDEQLEALALNMRHHTEQTDERLEKALNRKSTEPTSEQFGLDRIVNLEQSMAHALRDVNGMRSIVESVWWQASSQENNAAAADSRPVIDAEELANRQQLQALSASLWQQAEQVTQRFDRSTDVILAVDQRVHDLARRLEETVVRLPERMAVEKQLSTIRRLEAAVAHNRQQLGIAEEKIRDVVKTLAEQIPSVKKQLDVTHSGAPYAYGGA